MSLLEEYFSSLDFKIS